MTDAPETAPDLLSLKQRRAEVEQLIENAPGWGAYIGALVEELRGLDRSIAAAIRTPDAEGDG